MTIDVPLGTVALALAKAGCHVHPLTPGGKTPATRRGFHDATRDPERIRRWWTAAPHMNIGIATGASNLIVIDADHGKPWNPDWGTRPPACDDGADILINACENAGGTVDDFVGRWACSVATPSGGMHFYFSPPDRRGAPPPFRSGAGILPWVDVRALGGYVVAPWSVTPNGHYRPGPGWKTTVVADTGRDLRPTHVAGMQILMSYPELPAWLAPLLPVKDDKPAQSVDALDMVRALLDAPTVGTGYTARAVEGETRAVAGAKPGLRNDRLNRSAFNLGTLVGAGLLAEAEAATALTAAARAAGLGDHEAAATIRSGLRAGIAAPRQVAGL